MQESHPDPDSPLRPRGPRGPAEAAMAEAEPAYEMAGGGMITAMPMRSDQVDPNDPATWRNSPRNAPCPCGSGKKFKHCHGRTM